ncbi:MAG TPA: hypothetical protein EYO73_03375, partial [Sulfurimonas sp.]|nr:hypothetical protein [Sulfurimonas sp.]
MKNFLLVSLCLSSILLADNNQLDKPVLLSLEELMNIEITTASHEKEKTSESLAIVSVLTSTQLEQMGAINLYEALSFLPGIQLNETYIGYTVLTFRGINPGLYNNKALFMINGHPVHEKLFGSSHLEFIPLEMIDRIEVVRSPASVLYGTNAISGVVNVITKKGVDFTSSITTRVGSNNHYYGNFNIHDTHISMSASYQNDDGYTYEGVKDELGQDINKDYQNDLANFFIDMNYEQWRVQVGYYQSKKEKLGLSPIIQHGGINDFESYYFDVNKAFTIGDAELNIWLRYDDMEKSLETQKFPHPVTGNPIHAKNRVRRYSTEVQYKDYSLENLDYIIGLSAEYDKNDPTLFYDQTDGSIHPFSPIKESQSVSNIALYSQVKYMIDDQLTGIAGVRLDHNSDTDSAINPRLGLNYEYIPETYFKLLYSEAYRSPVFVEKYPDVPGVLKGDLDLKREKISTFELGLDTQINNSNSLQITSFYAVLKDQIIRQASNLGGSEYVNGERLTTYGLETQLNSILNKKTELMLNASYVDGKQE